MINRKAIVICNLNNDYGKTRPAVIVQSDIFNETHASVTLCPITSHIIDAPLFRLNICPTEKNGLLKNSQVMVDKLTTIKRDKIVMKVGELSTKEQQDLDDAIKLWLGLELSIPI